MKFVLSYKVLVYWLICNAVITICFGLFLAVACLFPTAVPALRALLVEGPMASIVPYIIFTLIVTSMILLFFYYDSRRR